MPNIETPSEFAQRFDPCARGEFIGVSEAVAAITARDAAIRAESAELLRVCGEALGAIPKIMESFEHTPDEDSCTGESFFKAKLNEDGFYIALNGVYRALAALRDAGVVP